METIVKVDKRVRVCDHCGERAGSEKDKHGFTMHVRCSICGADLCWACRNRHSSVIEGARQWTDYCVCCTPDIVKDIEGLESWVETKKDELAAMRIKLVEYLECLKKSRKVAGEARTKASGKGN